MESNLSLFLCWQVRRGKFGLMKDFMQFLVKCPIKEMSVNGRRQARLHTNIHCLYNWIFIYNFSEQSLPEQNARQDNNKSLTTSGRLRELETNPLIILKLNWTECTEHYKRWKIGRLWDRGNSQTHRWNPLNWGGPSLEEESKVGSGCGWASYKIILGQFVSYINPFFSRLLLSHIFGCKISRFS